MMGGEYLDRMVRALRPRGQPAPASPRAAHLRYEVRHHGQTVAAFFVRSSADDFAVAESVRRPNDFFTIYDGPLNVAMAIVSNGTARPCTGARLLP